VALSNVGKVVGDRFSVTAALPSSIVVLLVIFLVQSGAFTGRPDVRAVASSYDTLTGAGAVAVVAGVVLVSLLLEPFQFGLVRLLEGYWDKSRLLAPVGEVAVEIKRRKVESLSGQVQADAGDLPVEATLEQQLALLSKRRRMQRRARRAQAALRRYPRDHRRLLPTDLGNALRRSEDTEVFSVASAFESGENECGAGDVPDSDGVEGDVA
jgi:hypothetical protein